GLAEGFDRGDADGWKIVIEVVHERLDRGGIAVLAERLRGGSADPDVGVFERRDQRIETLRRTMTDDGIDRRKANGRRFIGQREYERVGETFLAEHAHQRDGLLTDDRIAVLRR